MSYREFNGPFNRYIGKRGSPKPRKIRLIIRPYLPDTNMMFSFEVESKSFLIRPLLSRLIRRCYKYSEIKCKNIRPLLIKCKNFISDRLGTACFFPFVACIPAVVVGFGGILRVYFFDRKKLATQKPSLLSEKLGSMKKGSKRE